MEIVTFPPFFAFQKCSDQKTTNKIYKPTFKVNIHIATTVYKGEIVYFEIKKIAKKKI